MGCHQKDPIPKPKEVTITLDVEDIYVSSASQELLIQVTSDGDWGVTSQDKNWVNVSPSGGGSGTSPLKVSISENSSYDIRETTLTFTTASGKTTLGVRQNYKVEEVTISDPAFKNYLLGAYDVDKDGILSTKEVEAIAEIKASGLGIKSMPELNSVFKNITYLDCSKNSISELALGGMSQLSYLNCSSNQLTTLDISLLVGLETLNATSNPSLTEIYVWTGFKAPKGFSIPSGAKYVEPEIPTPAGYVLVWQEEFNTPGESLADSDKWWYETGDGGWGNGELQDYVPGAYKGEMIGKVADGKYTITMDKIDGKVRSVRVNTKESWTYGYFEARLKLPKGRGTWPAFWMMPKNFTGWPKDGEIDIMEHVGYHQDYVSSSIHCTSYVHSNGTQKTKEIYLKGATDEFHIYALEWTPEYIRSFVDGKLLFYYKPEDYGKRTYDTWPFDNPFYLKLNLAWGGGWGGAQGVDETCLPAVYEIDYVRVFQKPN